jgi:predicted aspartyl protease
MHISTPLTVLLLAAVPAAVAGDTTSELRFQLLEDGTIIVPVTINGTGPFRFMLDTGSTRTVVSAKLTKELRLPVVAQSVLITPSGRDLGVLVQLNRLAIGDSDQFSVKALIGPPEHFTADTIDGLIGQDVLASLIYTIDYVRHRIVWHSVLESGDLRRRLPLETTEGRLFVSLPHPAQAEGVPLKFVPDSGSDGFVLFARGRQVPLPATPLEVGLLRTLSGQRVVRRVLLDDIHVGGVVLRNQTAVILERNQSDAWLGDGLLPLHVFARVTFHGPERYLVVEPR